MAISIFTKLHRRFGHPISRAELHRGVRAKVRSLAEGLPLDDDGRQPDESTFMHEESFAAPTRIAVVGAGFAGLAAAYYLKKHPKNKEAANINVTVFEPRKDDEGAMLVGGRVKTLEHFVPGRLVEAGAELIGLNHALWLTLARRFKLSLSVVTPEADFSGAGLEMPLCVEVNSKRVELDDDAQEAAFNEIDRAYVKLNRMAARVNAQYPWRSGKLTAALDKCSVAAWMKRRKLSANAEAVMKFQMENDQTVPVDKQSLLGLLAAVKAGATSKHLASLSTPSEYWTQTEVFRCAHGNASLAKALQAEILSEGGHFVEHAVHTINLSGRRPVITDATGYSHPPFDWLVVAVPPKVYGDITWVGFSPSGATIQCGPATKYLSRLTHRFWIEHNKAPSGADDRLGAFWEGTDNQAANGSLLFDLSFFGGGSNAAKLVPSKRTRTNPIARDIEHVLKGYSAALDPVKTTDNVSPENWPTADWIKTGYSCPAVGEVCSAGKFLNQRHGKLVFAGEHTSMAFFGYMEGALRSGLRAASLILGRRIPA